VVFGSIGGVLSRVSTAAAPNGQPVQARVMNTRVDLRTGSDEYTCLPVVTYRHSADD
jgi:hypothetical protein